MTDPDPLIPQSPRPPRPPLQAFMDSVLEWFVTDELQRNPELARRSRLVVGTALLLFALDLLILMMINWQPMWRIGPLPLPRPVVSVLLFAGVVNLSIAVNMRRSANPEQAALFMVTGLSTVFTYLAYYQGGFGAPVTWWLAAVPMLGAFLSGPRATVITAILVTAVLFLLYGLEVTGNLHPMADRMDPRVAQDVLRSQILLLGFATFFGWYYERTRQESSRDLVGAYSELERTNTALRMSQQNVRQIAEHMGQALWMHDLRIDRVVYANPAFEEVYGLSRAKLAARAEVWREALHPDDAEAVPDEADGRDHIYRIVLPNEESARWVRHSVYPVGDETTPTHRAIHIVADITLRRTAEALRERYLETVLEVQENERRHLARELHDETGQSLTALLVGLRALANTLTGDAQRDLAGQLAEQLREVVGDISRLARGLHPSVLDELGLIAAIGRLSDEVRDTHGVQSSVRVVGEAFAEDVSPTSRLTIYRLVQEALTNVGRHAEASEVDITLNIDPERVAVRVEDDGVGFDPNKPGKRHELSSGLGLMGMQERVSILGGSFAIESAPGMGTTVFGELPTNRRKLTGDEAGEAPPQA